MPQAFTSGTAGGGGGGSGTVTSVSSADTSIVVTNPTTTPSLQLAKLNVLATNEAPTAAVPLNGQKITGLANGTAATDAAAFGQIPAALPPSGAAGGDLTGTYPNPTLAAAGGGAAGPIGDATHAPAVTVDAKGRVTALSSVAITGTAPGGAAGGDLTGTYPNPTLGTSGVTAAQYGDATHVPQVTFDAKGRATAAANVTIAGTAPGGSAGGDLSGTYPNPAVKAITETSGPTSLVAGTITDGQYLKRTGATLVSGAPVASVAATDASIVVGGTATAPTIATGTLDAIVTAHAPAADWSNNSHKITSLANGTAAQDAAAFGQIPTGVFNSVVLATSDQSQTSNTTLTSDNTLLFAIGTSATETWLFEIFLLISAANTTMDIKFGLATLPTSAVAAWGLGHAAGSAQPGWVNITTTGSPGALLTGATTGAVGTANGQIGIMVGGWIFGGGTSGNITLQWAQNTSDVGTLTRKAGSVLRAMKVRA